MILRQHMRTFLLVAVIFAIGFSIRMLNAGYDDPLYNDDEGLQYFQESDSYYNYRLTENLALDGIMGDAVIGGKVWDLHSYYPPGVPLDYPPLLPLVALTLHVLLGIIAPVSLRSTCLILPALMAPLAGLICFFTVKRFQGDIPAFMGALLLVSAPFYLIKTVYGFYDTDMLILTVSLTVFFLFIEADGIERNRVLLSAAGGFALFLFSITWSGWQVMFYVTLVTFIILALTSRSGRTLRDVLETFLPAFMALFILLILFNHLELIKLTMTPFHLQDLIYRSPWYPWPDSYTSVAELQPASMDRVLRYVSPVLLLLGASGIPAAHMICRRNGSSRLPVTFLSVWTVAGSLMLLEGVRFIMMLIAPLAVSAGIFVGAVLEYSAESRFRWSRGVSFILIVLTVSAQLVISAGMVTALKPGYNDYFEESAQWIAENTPRDTVIITDWSYGHFYASEADRPVLYDGRLAYIETLPARGVWYASSMDLEIPTTARDYWINLALSSGNRTLSLNILRMLANSGDDAYILLKNQTGSRMTAYRIMNEILGLDRRAAMDVLMNTYGFSGPEALQILARTHPDDSGEIVIVVHQQMITMIASEGSGDMPAGTYSLIRFKDGVIEEKIINSSGNITVLETPYGSYWMNRKYRNSLLLKLILGVKDEDFSLIYRNRQINVYLIKS